MKHISKDTAKKETKISFRTTDAIFSQLKAISRIENISISFLVENILTSHLIRNETLAIEEEKRQAPRKKCSIPVVLAAGQDVKSHYRGMIIGLSPLSMQVVLEEKPEESLLWEGFLSLFSLSDASFPVLLNCRMLRMEYIHEECIVIVQFIRQNKSFDLERIKSIFN